MENVNVFLDFPPLPHALEQIAALDEEQFRILREAVSGVDGLDASFVRCRAIAGKLGEDVSAHDVYNIIRSLNFLRSRFDGWEDFDLSTQVIRELFEFIGLDKFIDKKLEGGNVYERIGELIEQRREAATSYEKEWLQTGIIDTGVDFDFFIDVRSRFSDEGSKIEEFIPVVIFRAVVENDRGEEKAHVFQLTEEVVGNLQSMLEVMSDQLTVVRNHRALRLSSESSLPRGR